MKRQGKTHPGNQKNKSSIFLARAENKQGAHTAQSRLMLQELWLCGNGWTFSAARSTKDEAVSLTNNREKLLAIISNGLSVS